MTLIQDGLGALITYLKAQPAISALVGARVYGLEVPKSEAVNMPREAIVINSAGGTGDASFLQVHKFRFDFRCYGRTPFDAYKVWRTLRTELLDMARNVTSSTLLYSAIHSAGPVSFRDQPTEWPVTIDTWLVDINDTIVT